MNGARDGADKNGEIVRHDRLAGLRKHSEELNRLVTESLEGALLALITQKPYDDISVTELCKKAGVSRTSFYSNFATKDEILKTLVIGLQRELIERIGSPFRQKVTPTWYEGLFALIRERADVLRPIFAAGFQDKYLEFINTVILHREQIATEEIYRRLLWCGGIVNTVVYWLATDMQTSIEEMADICNRRLASFHNP